MSNPAVAACLAPTADGAATPSLPPTATTAAGRSHRSALSQRRRQRLEGAGDLLSPSSDDRGWMAPVGDRVSPRSDGHGGLLPSSDGMDVSATPSGRKRKRTQATSTPVVEQLQPSPHTPEVDPENECEDYGHDWEEDEGNDHDSEWQLEDMDEDARTGCVEGVIEPEMVDGYLDVESNRQFRSKVWNEFTKIRVAGIVTKGQCIHCKTKISAKRGAGTSAMHNHLERCKVRRNLTNMSRQLKSVVMSPEGVALDNWRFSQETARRELIRMISLHGFPLSIVDYDGVRRFVSSLNPVFKMISRRTISRDSLKGLSQGAHAVWEREVASHKMRCPCSQFDMQSRI